MTTTVQAAVNRFEKAVREHAFIGAQYPEDRALIEHEFREAKSCLNNVIDKSLVFTTKERTFILNLLYEKFQKDEQSTFVQNLYKKINK